MYRIGNVIYVSAEEFRFKQMMRHDEEVFAETTAQYWAESVNDEALQEVTEKGYLFLATDLLCEQFGVSQDQATEIVEQCEKKNIAVVDVLRERVALSQVIGASGLS